MTPGRETLETVAAGYMPLITNGAHITSQSSEQNGNTLGMWFEFPRAADCQKLVPAPSLWIMPDGNGASFRRGPARQQHFSFWTKSRTTSESRRRGWAGSETHHSGPRGPLNLRNRQHGQLVQPEPRGAGQSPMRANYLGRSAARAKTLCGVISSGRLRRMTLGAIPFVLPPHCPSEPNRRSFFVGVVLIGSECVSASAGICAPPSSHHMVRRCSRWMRWQ